MTDRAEAFDVTVIGAGIMGGAATRHLATMGPKRIQEKKSWRNDARTLS